MTAVVQTHASTGLGSSSPLQTSFSSLPISGNSVIVAIAIDFYTACAVTGVTDNQGNSYSPVVTQVDSSNLYALAAIYWCPSIGTPTGTFTVSAAYSGTAAGGNCGIAVLEASGLGSIDQAGSATSTSTSGLTASATGANANAADLVVGGMMTNYYGAPNSVTSPPNTGYTNFMAVTSGVAQTWGYKIVSAVETSSVQASWGGAGAACAVIATFAPAASGNQLMGQICL
jgi:hypothetical protein